MASKFSKGGILMEYAGVDDEEGGTEEVDSQLGKATPVQPLDYEDNIKLSDLPENYFDDLLSLDFDSENSNKPTEVDKTAEAIKLERTEDEECETNSSNWTGKRKLICIKIDTEKIATKRLRHCSAADSVTSLEDELTDPRTHRLEFGPQDEHVAVENIPLPPSDQASSTNRVPLPTKSRAAPSKLPEKSTKRSPPKQSSTSATSKLLQESHQPILSPCTDNSVACGRNGLPKFDSLWALLAPTTPGPAVAHGEGPFVAQLELDPCTPLITSNSGARSTEYNKYNLQRKNPKQETYKNTHSQPKSLYLTAKSGGGQSSNQGPNSVCGQSSTIVAKAPPQMVKKSSGSSPVPNEPSTALPPGVADLITRLLQNPSPAEQKAATEVKNLGSECQTCVDQKSVLERAWDFTEAEESLVAKRHMLRLLGFIKDGGRKGPYFQKYDSVENQLLLTPKSKNIPDPERLDDKSSVCQKLRFVNVETLKASPKSKLVPVSNSDKVETCAPDGVKGPNAALPNESNTQESLVASKPNESPGKTPRNVKPVPTVTNAKSPKTKADKKVPKSPGKRKSRVPPRTGQHLRQLRPEEEYWYEDRQPYIAVDAEGNYYTSQDVHALNEYYHHRYGRARRPPPLLEMHLEPPPHFVDPEFRPGGC